MPDHEPPAVAAGLLGEFGELLVVDQRGHFLAPANLGQLRRGKRRVEQQHVGAELRHREHPFDEPAVVATHQPDPVPGLDALGLECVGQRVRVAIQLPVGEATELVDHHRAVGMANRPDEHAGRR